MATRQFQLSIGAKRQLTLPAELLEQLQIPERGELLVEVIGDYAIMTPIVSVPRTHLPEELRRTFESRRGAQSTDIPLAQFLSEVGYKETAPEPAAPPRRMRDRLASQTPNEQEVLQQASQRANASRPMQLTAREKQVLEQITSAQSTWQIAQNLGLAEPTVKSNLSSLQRKFGKLLSAEHNEVRS
jgi:DNA-binding CsgD family transcriptional regulator/bifunctional DNA-binding transcriptional regulator/antitoxin component of YhaV-PrlF toxin-antitoxin module